MIKKLLLLLLLLSPLLLASCASSSQERQTFAICISVDPTDDGGIKLGLQAPKSGQSSQGGVTSDYEVLTASGKTLQEALGLMAASTPYPINFSQLRLCILRYELAATTELRPMLRYLEELPTMRPNATVMVSLGDALAVMEAHKPEFGMRLSTHLNILLRRLQAELLLPVSTLSDCVRLIGGGYGDPLLCVCAVNPKVKKENEQKESQSGGGSGGGGSGGSGGSQAAYAQGEPWNESLLPQDMIAGMLASSSSNPVEYLGSATVSDGRVSGLMSVDMTQVALRAKNEGTRRVAITPEGGVQLQLTMKKDSMLSVDADALKKALATLQALDCDALRFGEVAMRAFWTDAEWNAFDFVDKYRHAEVFVAEE